MQKKNLLITTTCLVAVSVIVLLCLSLKRVYLTDYTDTSEAPATSTSDVAFRDLTLLVHRIDSLYGAENLISAKTDFEQLLTLSKYWEENSFTRRTIDRGWLYDWIGEFHLRSGNLIAAESYAGQAAALIDSIPDINLKTHILTNQANIASDLGNHNKAIKILFMCMDMYGADTTQRDFIDYYNNIGGIYAVSGQYDLAIQYFNRFLELATKLDLEEEFGFYHGNMGHTYLLLGDVKKSTFHLEKAKSYFKQFGQYQEELLLNTLLASNYVTLERLYDAQALLRNNLAEAERRQHWEVYVETTISLFELFVAQHRPEEAFEVMGRGLQKIHITNTTRLQLKIYDKLIAHYESQQDFQEAFSYLKKRNDIQEHVAEASQTDLMRELTVKYETERKADEIQKLTLLNAQKEKLLRNSLIGVLVLGIIITVIAFLLKRIATQKKALALANQTKDRFFSIIAHDLRSPLLALQGIHMLMQHYIAKKDEKKLLELGGKTQQTLQQVNHLLDNLLSWALKNNQQISFHPSSKPASELVEETLSLYRSASETKQLQLHTLLEEAHIYSDQNMVSSALRNVLSNAVKHTPAGSEITIRGSIVSPYYRISIRDQGPGIPETIKQNLQRTDESLLSYGNNSIGLGLRLTQFFIKKNHGRFQISNTTQGALAEIYVPLTNSKS